MTFQCLCPDGVIRDATWKFVESAWVPVLTVCNQRLFTYPPISNGMTFQIINLTVVDNATTVTPIANRTICRFPDSLSVETNFTTNVSNCEVGDELILIFSTSSEEANLTFPNNLFFIDEDARNDGTFSFTPRTDRWVLVFTFNGVKFGSTYEHC